MNEKLGNLNKTNMKLCRTENYLNEALYYASKEKDKSIYDRLKKLKTELINIRVDHTVKLNKLRDLNQNNDK